MPTLEYPGQDDTPDPRTHDPDSRAEGSDGMDDSLRVEDEGQPWDQDGPAWDYEDPSWEHAAPYGDHADPPWDGADQADPAMADAMTAAPVTEQPTVDIGAIAPPVRARYVPSPVAYQPPRERRFDPARWLRGLAGIDERLLRYVWFERARHTALGGIILGTGLIAGLSMFLAINESLGYATWLNLIPAVIWFIFIVNLDRVLVSTMVGQGKRWGPFLMRLLLAMMFGFIIAEPLTIRIFQTAIEQHIRDERTQQLDDLRSSLLACNTKERVVGTASTPAGCDSYLLSFEKTPLAAEAELAQRQKDEQTLAATIAADGKELARLTDLARKECAGTSGPGLTGQAGYGPDCRDRNKDVANFIATHPAKANQDRLLATRADIATLTSQIGAAQTNFEATRDTLIAQRVQEARDHQGSIGLLERMRALHALAASTVALFIGTWAVRLFFVIADCLPVVVKFTGGNNEYDRIFRAQAANSVARYDQDLGIIRDEADAHVRMHRSDLELEVQEHRADVSIRRAEAVGRVAAHMLGENERAP